MAAGVQIHLSSLQVSYNHNVSVFLYSAFNFNVNSVAALCKHSQSRLQNNIVWLVVDQPLITSISMCKFWWHSSVELVALSSGQLLIFLSLVISETCILSLLFTSIQPYIHRSLKCITHSCWLLLYRGPYTSIIKINHYTISK